MEAKELMIGDLVLFDRTYPATEKKPTHITLQDLIWINQGNDYSPIPITPESLEKNGFIKVNTQRYDYGCPDTDCYIKVNPKKNMIHINGRNANCNLYFHPFVHELQHALRLCGLTDLADNFKV